MNRRAFASNAALMLASTVGGCGRQMALTRPEVDGPIADSPQTATQVTGFHSGFTVPAGETWEIIDTLESDANVVVNGTLKMRSGATLRFVGVNENAYVGGGGNPIDSDIGLWVMGDGRLDVQGTPKAGWNDTGWDPTWNPTDDLVLTPTAAGDFSSFTPFALGGFVPEVDGKWNAEVLNLTRDVLIEGRPEGRAHVFIRSEQPQTIKHCAIQHMGPRQPDGTYTKGVLGRYGLHFHHCNGGSRGSLVEGVVIRDTGFHAFVPHVSHGITLRDCVAYDVFDAAYWWDLGDPTDDVLIDHCIAALVRSDPAFRGFTLAGFTLGKGTNTTIQNSVAVGVQGTKNASGFHWPSQANEGPNVWAFTGNVAHNNTTHGTFVWQNTSETHFVGQFAAYRCGEFGVAHGAYRTPFYHYADLDLFENERGGLNVHAVHGTSSPDRPDGYGSSFENIRIVGGVNGIVHTKHVLSTEYPMLFRNIAFERQSGAKIKINEQEANGRTAGLYDYVDCQLNRGDVEIVTAVAGSLLRVQNADGSAWQVDAQSRVQPIGLFYEA